MTFNRREFIKKSGLTGFVSLFIPFVTFAKPDSEVSGIDLSALRSYIDLLLPEDLLPGALQLKADNVILKKAEQDAQYAQAIRQGVHWLNFLAQKLNKTDFSSLPEDSQLKIVALSEHSQLATLPNLFYLTVRQDVFQFYYAHPEILKYFPYSRPPQPLGFADFTEAPVSIDD